MRVRVLWAAAVVAVLAGCTSVRMVQRDGCWVKQSKKLGQVKEELGPCAPPATAWSEDRLTRLVQECAVRADHRWRTLANSAFQRGVPLPERSDDAMRTACVEEATRLAAAESAAETTALREKLADAGNERDRLRDRVDREHAALAVRAEKDHEAFVARDAKERDALAESTTKLADWLGQAASKPSQPAVATATASSDGRARTESDQQLPAAPPWAAPAPAEAVVSFRAEPAAPAACAAPEAPAARRTRPARTVKPAATGGCQEPTRGAVASAAPTSAATSAPTSAATPTSTTATASQAATSPAGGTASGASP